MESKAGFGCLKLVKKREPLGLSFFLSFALPAIFAPSQAPAWECSLGSSSWDCRDPEHMDVKARKQPVSSINRMAQKLPSMALDTGIPAGMTTLDKLVYRVRS